jgi:hypothetical protein
MGPGIALAQSITVTPRGVAWEFGFREQVEGVTGVAELLLFSAR